MNPAHGIACPICNDQNEKKFIAQVTLLRERSHDLVACTSCQVLFFNPLPDEKTFAAFYSAAYFSEFDVQALAGKGRAFAHRLTRLKKRGRILDVGCALGSFLHGIASASDWDGYGVDIGKNAVQYATQVLQQNVRLGQLTDIHFEDAYFDFIHVNNVLEHVPDPVSMLRECRRILKPEGRMLLSVPNGINDSRPLVRYFKEKNMPALSPSGHIYFFPAPTILSLLASSGFRIRHCRTYGFHRGLRNVGLLPAQRKWHARYTPSVSRQAEEAMLPSPLIIKSGTPHSDLYYRFRLMKTTLGIPGLHPFGLDFLFQLQRAS